MTEGTSFEHLGTQECLELLRGRDFGRVCFAVDDVAQVLLTGYVVGEEAVYFRASAFGPVARQVESRPVTLQVDDMGAHAQAGWSVTFTGSAHRELDPATLASLWTPVRPVAWDDGVETQWIALVPESVRGQRAPR